MFIVYLLIPNDIPCLSHVVFFKQLQSTQPTWYLVMGTTKPRINIALIILNCIRLKLDSIYRFFTKQTYHVR